MKVGMIGSGMVGSTAGYAMALAGAVPHIVFADKNAEQAAAQAADIAHAVPFISNTFVESGDFENFKDAKVVVIAAGVGQASPSQSRLDLLQAKGIAL